MMSVAQKQSACRRGGGGGRMNRNVFFFLTELIYSVIEACAPQIIRLRPPLSDELEVLLLNVNETQSQSCSICKRSRFLFYLPRLMAAPGSQPFVTGRMLRVKCQRGGCSREIWRWWSCTAHLEPLEHVTLSFLRHSGAAC